MRLPNFIILLYKFSTQVSLEWRLASSSRMFTTDEVVRLCKEVYRGI